ALAHLGLNRPADALQELTQALELPCPTRVYFMRALVRQQVGDAEGARRDREEGLRLTPRDERSWIARGWARLAGDPRGALADFDQALALNPRSRDALQKKAHVLAEFLGRTEESVAVLDRLLALDPESVPALGGRGVLLARQGKRSPALRDAESCLRLDTSPP